LVEIRCKIARKLEVYDQSGAKLKKFTAKKLFERGVELWGLNWSKSGVKLKRFESLIVNWKSIYINPKPRTTMKMMLKFGADVEIWLEKNCIKSKVWDQLGVQLKESKVEGLNWNSTKFLN